MKVAVCINHVPDTETKIKVGADNVSIDRAGVNFMMSPYDEIAVEEGLRMRDKFKGEVVAISLGNDKHKETLRKALAMGVDKAVLLKDDSERDSFGVAAALAEELRALAPDVILFGKQSIDHDDAQVGTLVAEMLGLPSVGVAVKIEINDGTVVCHREIEGGHETVHTKLPAVFLAQKGLNEPRYPSLKGIMAAKSKPIEEKAATAATPRVETVALRKPAAKAAGRILGTDKTAVPELIRLLHDEAKII
ncbi:MAG: electron transfer flavoprotein subunit beta/FixA family protein [Ignavibacteriae bacterium]|nr:electron transfer flavoprotein subunit beta/FixA family protein [Ignavibacteriota bacterium]